MGKTQGLRHRVGAGVTATLLIGVALAAQAPGDRENRAVGFEAILWLRGGDRTAEFFTTVRRAGFTAVSVSGAQDPVLPGKHGLRFYRDQICGKGILELRDKQYRPIARAYEAERDEEVLVRPGCLSSSETLRLLSAALSEQLRVTLPQRPLAISLGDEISVTRHANPLDFCFAPASLRGFRAFLRRRHLDIDRLNAAWGTDFANFDRVRPFTADAIRARELNGQRLPANLAPWAAHREFMDREIARVVRRLVAQARRGAEGVPCGLTGIQPPSAYGGHDYARLLPTMSFFEVYDVGGARDLAMSLAPPGARQVATLFPPAKGEAAGLVTARLADMIAHGLWGVVVWSSKEVIASSGDATAYGDAVAAGLKSLAPAAKVFAGARLRRSPVWIVESQASVRAWWMIDSRRDGKTWIRRLSSYEREHSTSLAARHGWIRILEDLGLQPRLVPAATLAARLPLRAPRLLVLPATLAMSNAAANAIEEYVAKGGVVVADHTPGLYDERLHLRDTAALDALFGVRGRTPAVSHLLIDQGRPLPVGRLTTGAAAVERGLTGDVADPVSGFHVQIEHAHGKGRGFYLNMAVCEYGRLRLDPKQLRGALDLRKRVRFVLRQAKITSPVVLQATGMPTCLERMMLVTEDKRRLLAVRVNALEAPAILAELSERGPVSVQLNFPGEVGLVDLVAGVEYPAARQHALRLDPCQGLFLELIR